MATSDNNEHGHLVRHNHEVISIEDTTYGVLCLECVLGLGVLESAVEVTNINNGCAVITKERSRHFIFNDETVPVCDVLYGLNCDTLLHFASEWNVEWMTERILKEGKINVNVKNLKHQQPLMVACERGHLEIAKLLLEHGASVSDVDEIGRSVLHYVTGSTSLIQLLVEHGADLNVKDKKGRTFLYYVNEMELDSIFKYLLSIDYDGFESLDELGDTALMNAVRNGLKEKVEILVKNGFHLVSSDPKLWSPLHLAFYSRDPELCDFILSHVAGVKEITKSELLRWMLQPPFSDVTDIYGWNWIFDVFQWRGEAEEVLDALFTIGDDIPFSTVGPFGIRLDSIIYQSMMSVKPSYSHGKKEELDLLFQKLKRKSVRSVCTENRLIDVEEIFNQFVNVLQNESRSTWDLWEITKEVTSSLTLDWLKPTVGISYSSRYYNNTSSQVIAHLAPQVQLAMEPNTAYKQILEMKTNEGQQSLLHVAAENGNEIAVHLLLLFGAKNIQDGKKRLPYQCALEKRYTQLSQLISSYFDLGGANCSFTGKEKENLRDKFVTSIDVYSEFSNINIYSDIPGVDEILNKIKELKIMKTSGNKSESEKAPSSSNDRMLCKNERNLLRLREERNLDTLVNNVVNVRTHETDKVYTDGSCSSSNKTSGAAYYNRDSNTGTGYPLQPTDIHNAELVAVKIALEELTQDAVVLTDRQPVLKVLEGMLKYFRSGDTERLLLNWIILFRLKFPPNPYVKYFLHWIPAHEGLEGNDTADALAKKAMKEGRMVMGGEVEGEVRKRREKKRKLVEILLRKMES